ncbi:MAG: peptidoglycan editing factor PgeF [Desulfuromonadales bacterium]|nr:peptidoglycan editing factor PgeF [Desulfuromonadales bacterium]
MKNCRHGKITTLQPAWSESGIVQAGFTTRNGGSSRPPYNSLNLGQNTDDANHNIEANRATLTRTFGLPPHQLLTVHQVHGTDILILDEPNPDVSHFQKVESDAIITNQKNIMIGVLVADCYPVLLFDPVKEVSAVIHVGWRGAAAGLIGRTVAAMTAHFGSRPVDLKAAIGAGIGAHKYAVDRPVRDAFREGSGNWETISNETSLGEWLLDLKKSCQLQLESAEIPEQNIESASECTCCHRELFFSYRRDNGQTGRQIGFILLSDPTDTPK